MADVKGWSKPTELIWSNLPWSNGPKSGKGAIKCLKCGAGHIIGDCPNCSNETRYKVAFASDGQVGLFCSLCNQGFTTLTCDDCGAKNPINQHTLFEKSGCYIVTSCCGVDSKEVQFFKMYRDVYLTESFMGRIFIKFYYAISPTISSVIHKSSLLRKFSYNYFISPLYNYLKQGTRKL